jgi:hypothetical protein
MPQTDIGSTSTSDIASSFTDYSVPSETTDGETVGKENFWINEKWNQYLGYYKKIPELRAAIDARATWTVGKGYQTDDFLVEGILDDIHGNGVDTFNTILENSIRSMNIGGDAFCEIIRDDEGNLINVKPLDPGTIRIVFDAKGMITRYEQFTGKNPPKKFTTAEMFHLSRNRVADEVHGVSVIEAVEDIILMRNEAMDDWKRVMHRNVDPMIAYKLDTDDPAKIAAFKAKVDAAKGKGENMYIPQGTVEFEVISLAPNANLNPLAWIDSLNNYFYEAVGTPKIVIGNAADFTEASAKISYLSFQQSVEEEQLFIEEQVYTQLGLPINLEFPASLENELISDNKKDVENGASQPAETTEQPVTEEGGETV